MNQPYILISRLIAIHLAKFEAVTIHRSMAGQQRRSGRLGVFAQLGVSENVMTLINQYIWVNYNELTTSSLEIIVSKGNHPQMALIQVSEL